MNGMSSTFSPEEYVTLLYQSLLGREPDDHGLVTHSAALRRHGNPAELMKSFLASEEYRTRNAKPVIRRRSNDKIMLKGIGDRAPEARQDPCTFILEASTRHFRDPVFLKQLAEREDVFPVLTRPIKTIALYYWRLNNGGTERVTARQTLMWTRMGYNVVLITDQDA